MPVPTAVRCALLPLLLATAQVRAQALQLDVAGGSMPGTLVMDAYPEAHPYDVVLVVPSGNTGPTPLFLIDPLDSRVLDVGVDLLGSIFFGLTGVDGHCTIAVPLNSNPALVDTPVYFQALTLLWTPTLFDRVSNPNVIWLAPAGAFRDRFVSFANGRAFATVLPLANRTWLLCGGGGGGLLSQIAMQTTEIYDPFADTFLSGPAMTVPRSLHTMTELPNGNWLLVGGVGNNNDPQADCEVYDPALDAFAATAPMGTARMGHTATRLPNGKVLVTGGLHALTVTPTQLSAVHDAVATTEIYDPVANTWTPGPVMSTPRAGHIAVLRPDGKVLLAGGISWDPVIIIGWLPAVRRSCDLYDPVTNTMTTAPQMGTARSMVDAVPLGNDRWLFAGGISSLTLTNLGTPTNAAEIYDAVAGTWTAVGAMATARGNHKAWSLGGGQFLVAGGADGTILTPQPLISTEVFSTATNAFSPGPAMNYARAGAAMFATPQGQVQLFGGATTGGGILTSTEWYFF